MHLRSAFPKTASGKNSTHRACASSGNRLERRTASRVWARRREKTVSGKSLYNYFRDYDPATGRYVQSDPLGLVDSSSTYAYALSSPLAFLDPQGLSVFKIIVLCKDGYKVIRKIGFKEAVRRARKGEDVLASSKRSAKQVADAASGGAKKSVKDAPHKPGQSPHYHPNPRTGSHVLYSMASSLTFSNYSPCEDCITAKLTAIGDFFNPLSLPKDAIDLFSDDDDE